VCTSVVSFLHEEMEKLKQEPVIFHDHIRIAIRNAQMGELEFLYDYALMEQLGMRRTEWFAAWPKEPKLRRAGRAIFKTIPLEIQLIVGGFLDANPVLLTAWGKQPAEIASPFAVIGSGSTEATETLNVRGQNQWMGISRTLVHISEALDAARAANKGTVGQPSDLVILKVGEYHRISSEFVRKLA